MLGVEQPQEELRQAGARDAWVPDVRAGNICIQTHYIPSQNNGTYFKPFPNKAIAMGSDTSNIPQNDIGNYLGLYMNFGA